MRLFQNFEEISWASIFKFCESILILMYLIQGSGSEHLSWALAF